MKKLRSSLFVGILVLFSVISLAQPVSASSIYDDYFHRTESLEVKNASCSKDVTMTWMDHLGVYTNSFQNAYINGSWGVSQLPRYGVDGNGNVTEKAVIVYWNESQDMTVSWAAFGTWGYMAATPVTNSVILQIQSCSGNPSLYVSQYGTPAYISTPDGTVANFLYNGEVVYPQGYEGELVSVSNPNNVDDDSDGLKWSQEMLEGTLDTSKDTDDDGLSDYIESQWYPDRQTVFCGTSCVYPNPTKKDLYVEIDWMKNGTRIIKPSTTQLTKVEEAFADQDITVHFDTGQYGGGNELPTYTQDLSFYRTSTATDFYDYKYGNSSITANFDTDRYKIWHYVITGYRYTQNLNSSGASYVGDDDTFISLGKLEDDQGSSADNAIAGTLLHELGHSVCLSDTQQYPTQPTGCVYAGIDTEDDPVYSSYHSVMNYDYQFSSLVNLSNGTGTPEDHDDWSAVAEGMGDFVNSDAEGENPDNQNFMSPNSRTFTSDVVRRITH